MNLKLGLGNILAYVGVLFSVIELGLVAYLVGNIIGDTTSQISFMMFNTVWTLCVLAYLILAPMFLERFYNTLVALGLNAITTLFWFAGSIALAVHFRYCNVGYFCNNGTAAIVFGFLLWLIFTAITVLHGLDWNKSRGAGGVGAKAPATYAGA